MSPVRKTEVSIINMVTMDTDMAIWSGVIVSSLVVGIALAIVVYCLVIKRRRKAVSSSKFLATPIDTSSSYVHYGSPGFSNRASRKKRAKRKDSEYSIYTNNSTSDTGDEFTSFRNESPPRRQLKLMEDHEVADEIEAGNTLCKEESNSQGLDTCRNLSFNMSELGFTESSALSPTTLQITASTSLCEQCLSPPPSPPPMLGTSISLPPTTVEITKTALGISNQVSDNPVVCDTCLSPSKLGDTTRSLNLPVLGVENDLRQRKLSPSGIITNPRMKNPMLATLRGTMTNDLLATLMNIDMENLETIEDQESQENSFDSLLSPSKACDWLCFDPFEVSSDEDTYPCDPRMEKIKPVIKTKRIHNDIDRRRKSEYSISQIKSHDNPTVKSASCSENLGFITPLRNQTAMTNDVFALPSWSHQSSHVTPVFSQKSSCPTQNEFPWTPPMYSPVMTNKFPPVPPPSPFKNEDSKNTLPSIVSVRNSKTIVNITPDKLPLIFQFPGTATNTPSQVKDSPLATKRKQSSTSCMSTPLQHSIEMPNSYQANSHKLLQASVSRESLAENPSYLAWDSAFEPLKTLESSMKLEVTPSQKKIIEHYEDSPHDSNDSQLSQCTVDKSCMSLAWDNSGDMLAVTATASPESLNSSMQSVDIDEIIGRVAPNLSMPNPIEDPTVTSTIISKLHQVTMIPFLKRSATSIDMDALLDMEYHDSSCESRCKTPVVEDSSIALALQNSESECQMFSKNTHSPYSSALALVSPPSGSSDTVPSDLIPPITNSNHLQSGKQACSPYSGVSEDFLSTFGSMDSFTTAFEM